MSATSIYSWTKNIDFPDGHDAYNDFLSHLNSSTSRCGSAFMGNTIITEKFVSPDDWERLPWATPASMAEAPYLVLASLV